MKTNDSTEYRGYTIQPKLDFGVDSTETGFVVVQSGCNAMPGATWFKSVPEAKSAIDILIRVKGDAVRFWEIMQPFEYGRLGQRADFENGVCRSGRYTALIKNFKVIELRTTSRDGKRISVRKLSSSAIKRAVRQNAYGNWRGYEGGRFVREFAHEPSFLVAGAEQGTPVGQPAMPDTARAWLAAAGR